MYNVGDYLSYILTIVKDNLKFNINVNDNIKTSVDDEEKLLIDINNVLRDFCDNNLSE